MFELSLYKSSRARSTWKTTTTTPVVFTALLAWILLAQDCTGTTLYQNDLMSNQHHPQHIRYDHQHRDYYVIRISDPQLQTQNRDIFPDQRQTLQQQEQHHLVVGELLGLRFETRVGSLLDYLVYSTLKPLPQSQSQSLSSHHHHHQDQKSEVLHMSRKKMSSSSSPTQRPPWSPLKRSLDNFVDAQDQGKGQVSGNYYGHSLSGDFGNNLSEDNHHPDPVIRRFNIAKKQHEQHRLQQQQFKKYQQSGRSIKRELSAHESSTVKGQEHLLLLAQLTESNIVMQNIQKQQLRQRIKKRAPLLPDPRLIGFTASQGDFSHSHSSPPIVRQRDDGGSTNTAYREEQIELEAEFESDQEEQDMESEGVTNDAGEEHDEEEGGGEEEGAEGEKEGEKEGGKEGEAGGEEEEEEGPGDMKQNAQVEYQPTGEQQPDDGFAHAFGIEDPGFRYQWHLHNTKNGHDINVTGVWEQGINGTGVNVAIIDDGLDSTSEDLAPNFFKEGSWDFNDHTALPQPRLEDDQHGTRCAGEIAAAKNNLCGLGVAYGAKVAGLRILSGQITDVDEAAALNHHFQGNHIYSCSWGPPDDGQSMDGPKGVVLDAMVNGIQNGRNGLGSIYVFATGNGGAQDDDCNFDGYTNSLYTVSIGAIDRAERHPYYSEACSAQLAVTYSNGGGSAIYTCDVGERRCFAQHGGTSAAAPIAAGMIALVLSVRPDLTWRDVQYLLMSTAVPVSLNDLDWKRTAAGRLFNHKFGYGKMDAYRLVEAAKSFVSLQPQTSFHPPTVTVQKPIPQGDKTGLISTLTVTDQDLQAQGVNLGNLEHVTVKVNIEHQRRGDVEVVLISPNNIESKIGAKRRWDTSTQGFVNWTFMTVKHWDESPVGDWKLVVRDIDNPRHTGLVIDWQITFWGEMHKPNVDSIHQEQDHVLTEQEQQHQQQQQQEPIVEMEKGHDEDTTMKDQDKSDDAAPESTISETPSARPTNGVGPGDSSKDTADVDSSVDMAQDDHQPGSSASVFASNGDHETTSAFGTLAVDEKGVASSFYKTLYVFCAVISVSAVILGYLTRHRWMDGRGRYASLLGRRRRGGRRGVTTVQEGRLGTSSGVGEEFVEYDDCDIDFEHQNGSNHVEFFSSHTDGEDLHIAVAPATSTTAGILLTPLHSRGMLPSGHQVKFQTSSSATLPVQEATI
ncbi:pheromone processing endoprotease [Podila humilis]|nr:pheromone processing endoprotease [Podila humilis]